MAQAGKKTPFSPTLEQKVELLHDSVFYEMYYAFGISAHDPTDYCAWEHLNFSRMGHARALYDFFETPAANRRDDDALAEDFGFLARKIDRPSDDRARLNKQLFHVTYSRLHYNEKSKPWPDSILACLQTRCIEFIDHLLVQGEPFLGHEDRPAWSGLRDCIASTRELRITRPFLNSGVAPYTWFPGNLLETGKPELTRPVFRAEPPSITTST